MTLFVAYANGANDNFKGVATLYGANVTGYRTAIALGTLATFAGCVASVFLAEALVQAFSGKGLVPDDVATSQHFLAAVATGASATILLATVLGLPISTTHALTGALVGAGFVAAGSDVHLGILGGVFVVPLLVSPLESMLTTMPLYSGMHRLGERLGITRQSCVCIAPGRFVPAPQYVTEPAIRLRGDSHGRAPAAPAIGAGTAPQCFEKYDGKVLGVTVQSAVDGAHYLSAAAVSFARGVNDTPKIVALLLVIEALDFRVSMLAIAAAMAIGGLVSARSVAETMSHRISMMNDGQALTANLVTALLVIVAGRYGMPVSTTHVSVGAIAGVGLVNGSANARVVAGILSAWVLTLPAAALVSAASYLVYRTVL
jgi:PiT family inorganic phosphate transporter